MVHLGPIIVGEESYYPTFNSENNRVIHDDHSKKVWVYFIKETYEISTLSRYKKSNWEGDWSVQNIENLV